MLRHLFARIDAPRRRPFLRLPVVFCSLIALAGLTSAACAQERQAPSITYHVAFSPFYEGEYKDALKAFTDESRGSIKTAQSRWIDSICYETMVGECYYEMGHLSPALEHYTNALNLFVSFSDWMLRVQFPPAIQPATVNKPIPWGTSSRRSRLGHYPNTVLIAQGRLNNEDVVRSGGVVQPPMYFPVQVQEVVRCTTLAIRRRAKLLGPVCQYDPLTAKVLAALSAHPGPPNHWSEAWIAVELGLAMIAAGKETQGVAALKQGLVAAGEYDHPMTSVALLELGRLSLVHGEYPVASKYFEEATYAAFHYPDYGVLEEAFRYGAMTHLLANRPGIYPPLAAAVAWAKQKGLRQLQASLLLLAAENFAVMGQPREAGTRIDEARTTVGRRQMGSGRIGSRVNFLAALVFFQNKKITDGDAALTAAMNYMQQGSFWLFHISLADSLFVGSTLTPRVAMNLYGDVLRDPQPADWAADPMESLAVLVTPHPLPYEHWFEVALMRNEHETALEIADRARRHRFFSSMPFGGRLLSLRWILEGPSDLLDQQEQLHRQDLLSRYPLYDQLSKQARAVRASLAAKPLVAADMEALKQQSQVLSQLGALSVQQEAVLREMSVRREPAGLVFPPLRTAADIQKALPKGHAILAFFATSRHLYGFLMNKDKYNYWQVGSPATLSREIVALLRDLGQYAQNHELSAKDLNDAKWKQPAGRILDLMLKGSRADLSEKFDELVIVPDGVLWYLPFEALQVTIDGQPRPLISRVRIRYAPTASLATSMGRKRTRIGNTAVVAGRLYPREDYSPTQTAFEQIAKVLPGAEMLKSPLPAPSALYASLFNRLIVLDDINVAGAGPYDWAPIPIERTKPGNALSDWLWLPWGHADEVILPGFHTAAEDSLKAHNRLGPGNEMFLASLGLMASGTQTILLSRWRTGGQSSLDLVREFSQELPHSSPAEAWQRAVLLLAGSRLNLDAEPRIKRSAAEEQVRANHPFFWAGYMLIDSGAAVQKPEPGQEEPVVKIKKAEQPEAKPKDEAKPKEPEPPVAIEEPAKVKPIVPKIKPTKKPAAK